MFMSEHGFCVNDSVYGFFLITHPRSNSAYAMLGLEVHFSFTHKASDEWG